MSDPIQSFGLLSLPSEIASQIYVYAIESGQSSLTMSTICKQIYGDVRSNVVPFFWNQLKKNPPLKLDHLSPTLKELEENAKSDETHLQLFRKLNQRLTPQIEIKPEISKLKKCVQQVVTFFSPNPPPVVFSLPIAPCQFQRSEFDVHLLQIWPKIDPQIPPSKNSPQTIDEIRTFLNNPKNAERLSKVTKLDLNSMNLDGLPACLCNLSGLQELDLSNNRLEDIPNLSYFPNLKSANFSQNRLKQIPCSNKLKHLQKLELANNQLENIPNLKFFPNLLFLNLDDNKLSELPGLDKLKHLNDLHASKNKLESLPELSRLTHLKNLSLSENQLKILPDMSHLTGLQMLILSYNFIPQILGVDKMVQLNTFAVDGNPIQNRKKLSEEVKKLPKMTCFIESSVNDQIDKSQSVVLEEIDIN